MLHWLIFPTQNIPGYKPEYHDKRNRPDLSVIEQAALLNELSIINHISPDDPPTFMSYRMKPDDSVPKNPKGARSWSIHHVNFGIVMEERLRQEGVEVFLKYPGVDLPYENEVEFFIHHLKK